MHCAAKVGLHSIDAGCQCIRAVGQHLVVILRLAVCDLHAQDVGLFESSISTVREDEGAKPQRTQRLTSASSSEVRRASMVIPEEGLAPGLAGVCMVKGWGKTL